MNPEFSQSSEVSKKKNCTTHLDYFLNCDLSSLSDEIFQKESDTIIFLLTTQFHGSERKLTGKENFSRRENSKSQNSKLFFPFFVGFCPRGHLMDYHLPRGAPSTRGAQ